MGPPEMAPEVGKWYYVKLSPMGELRKAKCIAPGVIRFPLSGMVYEAADLEIFSETTPTLSERTGIPAEVGAFLLVFTTTAAGLIAVFYVINLIF